MTDVLHPAAKATGLRIGILGSRGYPSTYGGFETLVRKLAPFLADRGHEVTVYGRDRQFRNNVQWIDGVRVVNTPGLDIKSASTVTHGMTGALHAARERLDAMLVLNVANGIALPVLRKRGVPVIVNVDGLEWERGKWGFAAKQAFRLGASATARHASEIIVDAEAIGDTWREKFGVDSRFIPYGGEVVGRTGSDRVEQLGLTPREYALCVARLAPENNVEAFVDACEIYEGDFFGVVVGDANYDNPLQQRLRVLHAEGKLLWLGHVSDSDLLEELWTNCGVYFHGHTVGGTNPALLQALGAGAPTIASNNRFNREVLGGDAQLVEADGRAIGERICSLLADPAQQTVLSIRGKRIVATRYQWDDVCGAYETALLEAAGREVVGVEPRITEAARVVRDEARSPIAS
jgi:glycosyltransferase involved in cell wall biosynthesis